MSTKTLRRQWAAVGLLAAMFGCSADPLEPGGAERVQPLSLTDVSLYGIHFDPRLRQAGTSFVADARPDWMGGADGPRLWTVELVSGDGYGWFQWEGQCLANTTCGAFRALSNARTDIITRLDYHVGGMTVPTDGAGIIEWKRRLGVVFNNRAGAGLAGLSRVMIVGNEPNLCVEAGGAPGCAPTSASIPAERYAAAYREMRAEIHRLASANGQPDVAALVAGPSGGGVRGFAYLSDQLEGLCHDTVDGVALHAYGGMDDDPDHDGTYGFSRDLQGQIARVDAACGGRYRNVPLFVTEFSRGNRPHGDTDFVYAVYRFLHEWNAGDHHDIVAATYFLGRGSDFAFENITLDAPNDHHRARDAFGRAVSQRWLAGSLGAPANGAGASPTPAPTPTPPTPPATGCACRSSVDNFCQYGPGVSGCAMTAPRGYCDPNGDGSFADADWVRGYNEYAAQCRR